MRIHCVLFWRFMLIWQNTGSLKRVEIPISKKHAWKSTTWLSVNTWTVRDVLLPLLAGSGGLDEGAAAGKTITYSGAGGKNEGLGGRGGANVSNPGGSVCSLQVFFTLEVQKCRFESISYQIQARFLYQEEAWPLRLGLLVMCRSRGPPSSPCLNLIHVLCRRTKATGCCCWRFEAVQVVCWDQDSL